MKEVLIFVVGYLLGLGMAEAQTYVISNPAGYSQGTVQINGNQAQYVTPQGYVAGTATIYSNQVVMPTGAAVGVSTGYTVPMTPPTPPSPRVLQ
jgi:hypothetical protein